MPLEVELAEPELRDDRNEGMVGAVPPVPVGFTATDDDERLAERGGAAKEYPVSPPPPKPASLEVEGSVVVASPFVTGGGAGAGAGAAGAGAGAEG
jgi:hypothetical protein